MTPPDADTESRVLVLAPTGRDAANSAAFLAKAGLACAACRDMGELCHAIAAGAGVVILTEESLALDKASTLAEALRGQPVWSDLPVIVLTRSGPESPVAARAMHSLGNVILLERPVRVFTLVTAAKTALRARAKQYQLRAQLDELRLAAGHALSVTLPPDPLPLDGDPTRLAQVVPNLLNNAAKYTPDGGTIDLAAAVEDGKLVVRLRDNGVGIPADMLPAVFGLFTQVGRSIERAKGGLGIGLSLVKGLVEMHGGTVTAESAGAGHGSTFVLTLPLAEAAAPAAERAEPPAPAAPGFRVLVVDDNADGAESLAMMLDILGHTTATANDGPAALDAARGFRPEVVFLDIGLPGMNGYEVARRMRQEPAAGGAVLVALTGWGSEDDKRQARAAGFDFHLTKPADAAEVERVFAQIATRGGA